MWRNLASRFALATLALALPLSGVASAGTPPVAPKPKPITNLTSTSLTLNWEPYRGTATCLQIERKPSGGDWRVMDKCYSPTKTSYSVKNMVPGKFYTFKVVARNGSDKSDSSCRWEVTMQKASASVKSRGTVTVGWVGPAIGYVAVLKGPDGKVIATKAIPSNATSVTFNGLGGGKYTVTLALPASAIPSNATAGEMSVIVPFAIPSN